MHSKLLAIASAGVLMMAGTAAWAQNSTVNKTPGHMMQDTLRPRTLDRERPNMPQVT